MNASYLYYNCRECDAPIGPSAHSPAQAARLMLAGYCHDHALQRALLTLAARRKWRRIQHKANKKNSEVWKLARKMGLTIRARAAKQPRKGRGVE